MAVSDREPYFEVFSSPMKPIATQIVIPLKWMGVRRLRVDEVGQLMGSYAG